MNKKLTFAMAFLSSLFCFAGGICIILSVLYPKFSFGEEGGGMVIWIGFGLYIIGKGFFVGPMLLKK